MVLHLCCTILLNRIGKLELNCFMDLGEELEAGAVLYDEPKISTS